MGALAIGAGTAAALKASAAIGAAGAVGSAAIGAGSAAANSKRGYKYTSKLQKQQAELNEQAAQNAYNRQLQMYDYTYNMESPAALRKQLEEAGLNIGLMYGGGNTGGMGGGQMGSAPQGSADGGSVNGGGMLTIDPTFLAQVENIKANTEKTRAEAAQLEKTGALTEAETKYTEAQTKWLEENAPISQMKELYDVMFKAYEAEGKPGESFKFELNGKNLKINGESYSAQKLINDLSKDMVQMWKEGTEAQKNLAQAAEANQHVQYMIDQITQMAVANQIEFQKIGILNQQLELEWFKFNDVAGQGNREAKRLELMAEQVAYDTGTNMNAKNVLTLIFQALGAVAKTAGAAALVAGGM